MQTVLAIMLTVIFFIIAAIHFYWALGGKKWAALALPSADGQAPLFRPRPLETAFVGIAFLVFIMIISNQLGWIPSLNSTFTHYGSWFIPFVFLLRAMGEFRYVGFFKKVVHTPFAHMDTYYYSPLCLAVGIMSLIIKLL